MEAEAGALQVCLGVGEADGDARFCRAVRETGRYERNVCMDALAAAAAVQHAVGAQCDLTESQQGCIVLCIQPVAQRWGSLPI